MYSTSHHPAEQGDHHPEEQGDHAEGQDLGLAMDCWRKLAKNESRLYLLGELRKYDLGYAEVEEYSRELNLKFKSREFKEKGKNNERKIVTEIMKIKDQDEKKLNRELVRERNRLRKEIYERFNIRRSRKIVK